mmetsp:Transcript_10997/g.26367  ORF Transcript_10997/g.26367 Transcript_10997/m.26367 type:complete len:405 (+) Transcript_10997:151-1365(+)
MSSNLQAKKKKASVRFGGETTQVFAKDEASPNNSPIVSRRPKRPRQERPNADELDDVDDYVAEDDANGDDGAILGESQTLQAKRQRRLAQHQDDDDDDESDLRDTSLATEGIPIEPFNMDQEKNDGSGYFDGDTYIFRQGNNRDMNEEADAWLDNLKDDDDGGGGLAKLKNGQSEESSSDNQMDSWSETDLYSKLLPLVSDSETIAQAIVRYGALIPKNSKHKSKQQGKATNGSSHSNNLLPQAQMAKQALEDLTEAANALLLRGQVSIYQLTRQDLLKLLPEEEPKAKTEIKNNPTTNNNSSNIQWEYQGNQDGGQIHGPYTTQQMQGWIQLGYFVGAQAVKVRSVQPPSDSGDKKKSMTDDLLSDLMDDDDDGGDDKRQEEEQQRGEWKMSDEVDFGKYLLL